MKVELGTVLHGTLRVEDRLDAFSRTLVGLLKQSNQPATECQRRIIEEARTWLEKYRSAEEDERFEDLYDLEQDSDNEDLIYSLVEELNDLAPPYVYFGTTEGDGSDFGFWVNHEAIREDVSFGILPHYNDMEEVDLKNDVTFYECNHIVVGNLGGSFELLELVIKPVSIWSI